MFFLCGKTPGLTGEGFAKAAPLRGSRQRHAVGRSSVRFKAPPARRPYRADACHRLPALVMTGRMTITGGDF
ncbi:MAG TPA: hypothetical protein DER60_04155 [Syntrophomonas sp.]|nr:hypothetical protein [Syntrophomonas sp.]